MKKYLVFMLFIVLTFQLHAQQKYWIYLNEKNSHLKNASTSARLLHLRDHGLSPVVYSEWLRAVSIELPDSLGTDALEQPCIHFWEPVKGMIAPANLADREDIPGYDQALRQIHAEALIDAGYTGSNVKIGVIDAGFHRADKNRFLKELIENGQVKGFRNFVEPEETDAFTRDYHGTKVLTHIAGSRKDNDQITGMAYDALFYLARTDQDDREYRGEEDYWIAALEWMHEQGVRIVNSSLGYSDGYDNPEQNYLPENADGKSSAISRAATIAVKEKGMILVVSAGNEGNRSFRVVSIPADAQGVLAVGATSYAWPWVKQGYSSIGPPTLGYVKPDVACYSFSGTSYSAPVIAGLAASIWQARPDLSNEDVTRWIRESSHLASVPNNFMGYGVPDSRQLLRRILDQPAASVPTSILRTRENSVFLSGANEAVVVYHKTSPIVVHSETVINDTENGIKLYRPKNVKQTTVVYSDKIVEIIWEED